MNIRRECRYYYPFSLRLCKQLFKGFPDLSFRLGISRSFSVSRVGHKSQNAFASKLAESRQVNYLSVNGAVIYFKITGMNYDTGRRMNRHSHSVRNRMVYPYKLNRHTSHTNSFSVRNHVKIGLAVKTVFL